MGERRAALAVALVALAALAGCASVPASGPVRVGRQVAGPAALGDADLRVLPPAPKGGETPDQIVRGFLNASLNGEDDYAIARQYLTDAAAERWNPSVSITVYDERSLTVSSPRDDAVRITATRVGVVDAAGSHRPATGTLSVTLHLRRVADQWRIDDPPPGVLLTTLGALRSFRAHDVYFLDRTGSIVVPDRVLLLRVSRSGVPTALVRAVVDGPTRWLAPVVQSAVPQGTRLIGNVPVNDGVADVNLSRDVLKASPEARVQLSAQLVWTLRQVGDITAVRILAQGTPLSVEGVGDRQPVTAWDSFDPTGASDSALYYLQGRALRTTDTAEIAGPLGRGQVALRDPAVSLDGATVAALVDAPAGRTLVTGPLLRRPVARYTAQSLTAPSFDRDGAAWSVARSASGQQRVVRVTASGQVETVTAGDLLHRGVVTGLRVSRDRTHVAAVVSSAGVTRVLVGRIHVRGGGLVVDGFYDALPGWRDVGSVAWGDASHLVVLARGDNGRGRRMPVRVDVDGYVVTPIPLSGLSEEPTQLAAEPGAPVVVRANGRIWLTVLGVWKAVGGGTDPVYPG